MEISDFYSHRAISVLLFDGHPALFGNRQPQQQKTDILAVFCAVLFLDCTYQ